MKKWSKTSQGSRGEKAGTTANEMAKARVKSKAEHNNLLADHGEDDHRSEGSD